MWNGYIGITIGTSGRFLFYFYSTLKKCLSVLSSYCVCVVFVLFFLHLSVCYGIFMTYSTSYCCHYTLKDI
jgi:hypothetical protein